MGTLDKSFQMTMEKFDRLTIEMEKTTEAIKNLTEVIVKLDKQNQKLQKVGLILAFVVGTFGAVDIISRILPLLYV